MNEFGQGGDDEQLEAKVADKPLTTSAGGDSTVVAEKATGSGSGSGSGKATTAKKRKGKA